MATQKFDYEQLIETALRGVVHETMEHVVKNGLMGDQHFYVSFLTQYPGVELPEYLLEEYPEEITIVLQHQFFGLKVFAHHFEVMLVFRTNPERVVVPFDAITDFLDPSQRFCLKFMAPVPDEQPLKVEAEKVNEKAKRGRPKKSKSSAKGDESSNVVTLDSFRKK